MTARRYKYSIERKNESEDKTNENEEERRKKCPAIDLKIIHLKRKYKFINDDDKHTERTE